MKKILVTGGLGFIGSNLIKILLKKKYYVVNLDKITYASNFYNTKEFKNSKKYKFIKCDINDQKKIFSTLKKYKPSCIFNLAAETHVDRSIDNPENFIQSNFVGVYNLLECFKEFSKKYKSKLIHISTDEVYGDIKKNIRSKENDKYEPSSPYSATKASADHLIKSFVRTYKLPIIISNCCNNYGPNQFPEKLIPKLIYNIINNKPLPIYGRGKNSREWIYVLDHCEALLKIFLKGKIGESYNVGTNRNIKNIDMVKKLLSVWGIAQNKSKVKYVKDRPGHDFRYALDSRKIRQKLKWKPKISLDEGLKNTFEWYVNNIKFFNSVSKKLYDKRLGLKND